ncbi:ABC transporter substrate-binding protein/permease [Streptomyces sp. BBFR102]|uniref:ABC transporter substrate-binding protein/permease n=1 Tax=Streptomyces sp. BBFR102 TaxID=3448171 RepID=UPI003F52C63E
MSTLFGARIRRWSTALLLLISLVGALGAVATTSAQAADGGDAKLDRLRSGKATLRVGTDATFPPFEFTKADGTKTGFDIDLVQALAKKAGIKHVKFEQIGFGNIVPALQADQVDVGASAIYVSEEREKAVEFSDIYYPGGLGLFVPEENDDISSIKDAAGKRIAVQVGTKSVEWLKENAPDAEVVSVQTNEQMFSSVALGQADAVVTGAPAAQYYIAQHGKLKMVGDPLTDENYGYAFQRGDDSLTEAFDTALASMKKDGSYDALTAEWFGQKPKADTADEQGFINLGTITESAGEIWSGLLLTLAVIGMALVLSLVLGLLGGLGRLSRLRPLRWIAGIYVSVIRGTPFVVQMFFVYFGLPQLGLQLPPVTAGVLSLGLYSGSYVTEILRGAVQSVEKGQYEAARSTGMSHAKAMRHVVLPQAGLRMLPPLANEFVAMTKNSALVSFITIHELFLVGQTIISRTFDAVTVYVFIGLLYWLITNAISLGMSKLEKKMAVYV